MELDDRPNILLIMTDQHRWDALGSISPWMHTPHLDQLAKQGVSFTQCVTNAPVCKPARFSLATGLYPDETGITNNFNIPLDPEQDNWYRRLKDSGYHLSVCGKTHFHRDGDGIEDKRQRLKTLGFDQSFAIVFSSGLVCQR